MRNNENDQIFIAIEKYLSLIMLEFSEHLDKYKNLYSKVNLFDISHVVIQKNIFRFLKK